MAFQAEQLYELGRQATQHLGEYKSEAERFIALGRMAAQALNPTMATVKGGRKKRKRGQRSAPSVAVKVDGVSSGYERVGKSKKRKKKSKKFNAKKEIAAVKKLIPKKSYKHFRDFKTMVLSAYSPNSHSIYDIEVFSKGVLQGYAQNLTLVDSSGTADYDASNTSLKYNLYYKLMMKNNMTANNRIMYAFYICKDDDDESPIDCIREELVDRGYTGLASVTAKTAASSTASEIPRRMDNGSTTPFHIPIFGAALLHKKWRQVGKVKQATIGPGDTLDIVWSRRNFTFKPEYLDQEGARTYLQNYDVRLVISVMGQLAHDSANTRLVGRSGFQYDCEEQKQCTVMYGNPKALNEVEYSDTLTNVNYTGPVHADNQVSAIETDSV